MKKSAIFFCFLLAAIAIISCRFPGASVNVKQSEYDHYFELTADFNPDRTAAVERLLDRELAGRTMSFVNTTIDGDITLDDKSTFYIKKSRGFLHIKLDRRINSDDIYYKIKSVGNQIKDVVR